MTSDTEHPQSETGGTDVETSNSTPQPAAGSPAVKKKAPPKVTAEVLQRRREGRIKAAATIASNLKKTGIGRFEEENKFALTSVKQVPLVNQKNYYTDYLKKDEQISFVRNWRSEKLMQSQNNNKLKKAIKKDDNSLEPKNFDDYDLGDIEAEMRKKQEEEEALARAEAEAEAEAAAAAAAGDDVDDDVDDDDDDEVDGDVIEHKAKQGYDTIVIQPGSSNIRIGRATDAFPLTIPTVLAMRPKTSTSSSKASAPADHQPTPVRTVDDAGNVAFDADFDHHKDIVTKDFKARMKYYKRRILPNSRESAANYNKKQEPERIPDHNDPYKKEWLDLSEHKGKTVFIGEDALNLPIVNNNWLLRFPIKNGVFNDQESYYDSPEEIIGDLACIIFDALEKLDITKKQHLAQLKAVLVIPDLYDKVYVENWVGMLFKQIGFGKVAIIQEAVAATFGAGAQSACVVDVGSQTTTISCVDEGLIINDSRITLNFGGDNITETFIKLLLESSFPYKGIDLSGHNDDWELAESLKKNYVTFSDADIAVQLYNFYKRKPNELTEKYEFKVFDEVMIAPLGLFYPGLFQIKEPTDDEAAQKRSLFPISVDQYSGKPNNPFSKAQENISESLVHADLADDQLLISIVDEKNRIKLANPYSRPRPTKTTSNTKNISLAPLEKAIIESITNAGISTDFNKVKRLYDNLLIVGGGFGKIPAFDLLLTDRINIWRPKFLSSSTMEEILEYVTSEKLQNDNKKKELIDEFKTKKLAAKRKSLGLDAVVKAGTSPGTPVQEQETTDENGTKSAGATATVSSNLDDIELEEEELAKIDKMVPFELDLDYIDSISDKGSLLSINVLPPPREFDPEVLTWKGGSVYSRLKVINEMWVSQNDWDLLESRCLYYKSLFNY
ncbi:actin-like protein Arp8p [[Candida] railenensis]|uniref:Actin-like protein Arp8p n=1 Tax=[Candida] railenensis TaxID=45579 RepID=A0A9P0QPD0_9ASCO|nr:actin-like protein Arp8p [[Candida] railenensis]